MLFKKLVWCGVLALLGASAFAAVEDCENDAAKYCPKMANGSEWDKCMRSNMSSLSAACQAQLKSVSSFKADPCEQDAARFCRAVPAGSLQKFNCLYKNETAVSEACKTELRKMRPCKKNIGELCASQDFPLSKIDYCLTENASEINNECSSSMKIPNDFRNLCFPQVTALGCKIQKKEFMPGDPKDMTLNLRECVWVYKEKVTTPCLKAWLKRSPGTAAPDVRKRGEETVRKIIAARQK